MIFDQETKTNYTYGIIGAMDYEIERLVSDMKYRKEENKSGLRFYIGTLKNYDVVIVKCGIGKVNAGRTTQVLISEYKPKYIINTGIGGGLNDKLNIGDIIISSDLIQHDFDVSVFGYAKGYLFIGNKKEPTKFKSNDELSERMKDILEKVKENRKVYRGRILTGDIFISSKEKRLELVNNFKGDCCEMEGAAVAQVAFLNDVPFTVIRLISDLPNGQGPEDYNKFEKEAAILSSIALEKFLES